MANRQIPTKDEVDSYLKDTFAIKNIQLFVIITTVFNNIIIFFNLFVYQISLLYSNIM